MVDYKLNVVVKRSPIEQASKTPSNKERHALGNPYLHNIKIQKGAVSRTSYEENRVLDNPYPHKKTKKGAISGTNYEEARVLDNSYLHRKKTKKKGATSVAPKPPKEDGGVVQTKLLILGSELFNHQEQELTIQF